MERPVVYREKAFAIRFPSSGRISPESSPRLVCAYKLRRADGGLRALQIILPESECNFQCKEQEKDVPVLEWIPNQRYRFQEVFVSA